MDWIYFNQIFSYLGPVRQTLLLVFTEVTWGTAHVMRKRLGKLRSLIQLALLILLFFWCGTTLRLHMSDLVFSIIMLTTFCGTFVLNGPSCVGKPGNA